MDKEEIRKALIKYRLESAEEKLKSSKILLDNGQYKDSIGRSYYAIYTSLRAIMAKDGLEHSKHAGTISDFQKNYIKTQIFDRSYSAYITEAFQIRNSCDYDDFYIVSKTDAVTQYENAQKLYEAIKCYLNEYVQ